MGGQLTTEAKLGMGLEQLAAAPQRQPDSANLMVQLDSPRSSRVAPPRQQQQQPQLAPVQAPPLRASAAPFGSGRGGAARVGGGSDGAGPRDWGAMRPGWGQPAQAPASVRSHQDSRCAFRGACFLDCSLPDT